MTSWLIFRHSWRQVFGNLPAALRLTAVPYGLLMAISFLPALWIANYPMQAGRMMRPVVETPAMMPMLLFPILILALILSLWMAVAWHRYILTEERGGVAPPFHFDRILGYFGKGLLIGLIAVIPAVILLMLLSGILSAVVDSESAMKLASPESQPLLEALTLIVLMPVIILISRLSVALPGVALAPGVPLSQGWDATKGQNLTIAGLVLLTVALNFVIGFVAGLLFHSMTLSILWQAVSQWIVTMVGLSILTTLYGHYVEKRPLV